MTLPTHKAVLDTLASKIADYEVLPFIGAGVSQPHVGYDWNSSSALLANDLALSGPAENTEIAQLYVDHFGRARLIDRLKDLLTIKTYVDKDGDALQAIANLGLRTYYTTNPDNVFEKYCERYQIALASVVSVENLRALRPAGHVLYKYHGDFNQPDSVVWTTEDYNARAAAGDDFFLNVRLKSDLLVKSLLFIGYSVRDAHIARILSDFAQKYPEALRGSYVFTMGDGSEMRARTKDLNLEVIVVREVYPGAKDDSAALAQLLTELNEKVIQIRASRELQSLFTPSGGNAIAAAFEVENILASIPKLEIDAAINAFRALVNGRKLPGDFEKPVADAYVTLAERVKSEHEARALAMAQFGLRFQDPGSAITILCATYALRHITGAAIGMDLAHVTTVRDQPDMHAAGILGAAALLTAWKRPLNEAFADWVAFKICDVSAINSLKPDMQKQIRVAFSEIFRGSPRTNPLLRQLPEASMGFRTLSFDDFMKSMLDAMPKTFRPPGEDR